MIDCFLFVRIETGVVIAMHVSLVMRKGKKANANVEIFVSIADVLYAP